MEYVPQRTQSLWQKEISLPALPPLESSLETDVCIVGAGIAGLLCAYELLQQGLRVVVLERGPLEKNQSGYTTSHLADALDDGFDQLLRTHGEQTLRLFYKSHRAAISLIEKIVQDENIDCNFKRVNGYLFLSPEHDPSLLAKEYEAAILAGADGLKLSTDFSEAFFRTGPALRFENQAQINPLKFIRGLITAIQKKGGQIFEHTEATDYHEGEDTHVMTEGGHRVKCQSIILATNSPTSTLKIYLKQAAYRTYCVAVKIPKGSIAPALYWDTQENYHYIRMVPLENREYDALLIGGEDHRVGEGHPEKAFENLYEWAQRRLSLTSPEVLASWSGQILEPMDSIAFIGRSPGKKNTYIVTGDSGHGYTHSAIASRLLTGLIKGEHQELEKIFDPNRLTLKAAKDYVAENANTFQQYADWVLPHDSIETLGLDEGCIVNHGTHKMAIYKNEEGHIFKMSGMCPHLGGLVKWNSLEKTWDCPCHGSRFDKFGACLHPPATSGLKSLEDVQVSVPENSLNFREPKSKT
ncbi:FAD-dependent oxidoreductase [Bdellovibrio sp. HCB185ZH]|uniref:FAD-dependent oxidoreductase n=1 Tax=Bdellovibrio sp. HCB185ZH TaxID=3394235 RepID=UPI0039A5ABDC